VAAFREGGKNRSQWLVPVVWMMHSAKLIWRHPPGAVVHRLTRRARACSLRHRLLGPAGRQWGFPTRVRQQGAKPARGHHRPPPEVREGRETGKPGSPVKRADAGSRSGFRYPAFEALLEAVLLIGGDLTAWKTSMLRKSFEEPERKRGSLFSPRDFCRLECRKPTWDLRCASVNSAAKGHRGEGDKHVLKKRGEKRGKPAVKGAGAQGRGISPNWWDRE